VTAFGIVECRHGIDQAFHHIEFVKNRELGSYCKKISGGIFRGIEGRFTARKGIQEFPIGFHFHEATTFEKVDKYMDIYSVDGKKENATKINQGDHGHTGLPWNKSKRLHFSGSKAVYYMRSLGPAALKYSA
jgi:hypothetical protein